MGNANTCTSCISGFSLKGWKCVSNFNFGVKIVLSVTLENFYENYQGFLLFLANIVSSTNVNSITVNSIIQGSTIADVQLTTNAESGSNEASNEYSDLSNSVSSGGDIAGMSIESSEVSVNGGEILEESYSPNLALILGICIPAGVIRTYL